MKKNEKNTYELEGKSLLIESLIIWIYIVLNYVRPVTVVDLTKAVP